MDSRGICIVGDDKIGLSAAVERAMVGTNIPVVPTLEYEKFKVNQISMYASCVYNEDFISDCECGDTPPPGRTQKNHNLIQQMNKRKR